MDRIGEVLKEYREKKGLSFREAADIAGLSHSYIRYLEKGERPGTKKPIHPTPEVLQKLARAYSAPYEELMVAAGYLDSQLVVDLEDPTAPPRYMTIEESEAYRAAEQKRKTYDIGHLLRNNHTVYFDDILLSDDQIEQIIDMIKIIIRK